MVTKRILIPGLILLAVVIVTVVLLVVFLVPGSEEENDYPLVETSVGSIEGRRGPDGGYDIYLGIPYAQVNESNLFGPSRPYPQFDGVFVADDDSARCPQLDNNSPVGSPDCLQLNVFVPPSASATNLLPVMIWINGNDFETNSKSSERFGPQYLIRYDVIYVSINYRVGPYGFMCLDIPEVPGNQGLKDQVLALRWVRNNIEAFGGDVTRITAFGTSAGGQSIDFHILADSAPLFNNAILQSGSAVSPNVFTERNQAAPITLAASLGLTTNSVYEALAHLSSLESNAVVQAWQQLNLNFKPCTELSFSNVEPFLTRNWLNGDKPNARGMSILTGYNEQEQLLQYVSPDAFSPSLVNGKLEDVFNFETERQTRMERNVRNFYFGDYDIDTNTMAGAVNFDSDYTYAHPVHRSIVNYLRSEAANVFFYVFSYNGGRNAAKYAAGVTAGSAAHGDEVGYLFDMDLFENEPSAADQLTIDRLTTMWTNFAKYSNPTPATTTLLPVSWSPISVNVSFYYLSIDSELSVNRRPSNARMTFWDLFYRYNADYQKGFEVTY